MQLEIWAIAIAINALAVYGLYNVFLKVFGWYRTRRRKPSQTDMLN